MWIPCLNGIGWRMETMKWNRIQRTKWELYIRLNNRARENQQHLSCVFYYNSVLYLRGLVSLCSLQSVFLSFFCWFVHVIECFFNAFQHEHSYKYSLIFSLRHRRSTTSSGCYYFFIILIRHTDIFENVVNARTTNMISFWMVQLIFRLLLDQRLSSSWKFHKNPTKIARAR